MPMGQDRPQLVYAHGKDRPGLVNAWVAIKGRKKPSIMIPTPEQMLTCLRMCQTLYNFYTDIHLFRYDENSNVSILLTNVEFEDEQNLFNSSFESVRINHQRSLHRESEVPNCDAKLRLTIRKRSQH